MENIVLNYPMNILVDDANLLYSTDRAEVFLDEHNVQWIKFVAKNGYHRGDEHIIHARRCTIVNKSKARRQAEAGEVK